MLAKSFPNTVALFENLSVFTDVNLNRKKVSYIVLTPGKTGSSYLYNNLKKYANFRCYHIHYLNPKNVGAEIEKNKNSLRKSIPKHMLTSKAIMRQGLLEKKSVEIFVILREPVTRKISTYFQNLDRYFDNYYDLKNISIADLIEVYKKIYLVESYDELGSWVNTELHMIDGLIGVEKLLLQKTIAIEDSKVLHLVTDKTLNSFTLEILRIHTRSKSKLLRSNESSSKYYSEYYEFFKCDKDIRSCTYDSLSPVEKRLMALL